MMTWSELKTSVDTLYSQYVGASNLIESTSGSPTALAILVNLIHNRILHYPINWEFLKETSTITLTGASTYDLGSLFPDLLSVYQLYYPNEYRDNTPLSNSEANISPIQEAHTIKGKILTFTGQAPSSGTISIQYKSKYMVKTAAGVRQKFFLDDTDVTVLDDENLILWGLGEYVNWASDDTAKERRLEVRAWFKESWENLFLSNVENNQVNSLL